jgi:hypothetical protein
MEINLKMHCTKDEIKSEVERFINEIKIRKSEVEMLRKAVGHYRDLCDHEGQKTGYNDRDGDWGNPCPTCGYSY